MSAVSPQQARTRSDAERHGDREQLPEPAPRVSFGAGTSVTATNVGSPTSLTATVVIAANATLGARDVTVINPDGAQRHTHGGLHDRNAGRRRR